MTQTAIDYSDIFCQAVQNIVNGTVSNLNFDISRECTIIDIIDKAMEDIRYQTVQFLLKRLLLRGQVTKRVTESW